MPSTLDDDAAADAAAARALRLEALGTLDTLDAADAAGSPVPPKPLMRGWSHVAAFFTFLSLATVMTVAADASVVQRLWLVVYEVGTLAMLGVSSLYHRVPWTPARRAVVRKLDHSTIFLAIAGAYTPVCALAMSGWQRPAVLTTVWVGTLVGIALQWVPLHVPRALFTAVYVVVGWSCMMGVTQLVHVLGWTGFGLLLAGGCAYTVGAVVYAAKRPDPWPLVFGYHEVFHLCTIVGVGLHLATIAFVVVPRF